jgi:hypothetical protein
MVRRRVEDPFERAEAADELRVEAELPAQAHRVRAEDPYRIEAEQRQRPPKRYPGERRRPRQAQRGGEVEVRARVMRHVGGPQHADAVARAMERVEAQVVHHEEHDPCPRVDLEIEQAVLEQRLRDRQRDQAADGPGHEAAGTHREVHQRVASVEHTDATAP